MRMKRIKIATTLVLCFFAAAALAQSDSGQATPPTPPVAAFGQQNPAPQVGENPPISGIDMPGLEPHAAPESFLLTGLHFSESLDSNVTNAVGAASVGEVSRGLGSVTLQRLWKTYDVAADYIGGALYYKNGPGLEQLQQFDMDNRINWKRGQLAIRDSFSYLPEGVFGFGAYGGGGAYQLGLGSLGAGLLGAGAFGGQTSAFNGGGVGVSLGEAPRITNLGLVDVVEDLSPKSAITAVAGYGLVHFYGSYFNDLDQAENVNFIGSKEWSGQLAYNRVLNPKDQMAISYGYQAFDFSTVGSSFHSNVIQLMYGHRVSGRMDFMISAGPQFTHISASTEGCSIDLPLQYCTTFGGTIVPAALAGNHIGAVGRVSLRYRFSKMSMALSVMRYDTSGSGIFAGALTENATLTGERRFGRVWDGFADFGYSRNARLESADSAVNANVLTYGYAGVGLHRQFSRSLRGFISYQFNELGFDSSCPIPSTSSTIACSHLSQRQVGTIGVDWTSRPIRLD